MSAARRLNAPRFRLQVLGGLTLLRPDGTEDPTLGSRGRKLVLLAYLALSRRPVPRDRLATFLWGHRDDERARHSLRDALSVLRQALGAAIPSRRETIALAPDAPLDIDLLELQAASRAADHVRVVELYRGAFLDGVYVSDAHEVTDWIDEERSAAERLFVMACAAECARLALARDWDACASLARRWLDADPLDAAALEWRLRALGAPDTPAALRGAIAEYHRHDALLVKSHDEAPAPSARLLSEQFAARLSGMAESIAFTDRENGTSALVDVVTAPSSPETVFAPARPAIALPRSIMRRSRRAVIGVAVGLGVVTTAIAVSLMKGDLPLGAGGLIVAGIENPSPATDDNWLEDGLPRLLASSLIREQVPGVVDPSRVRAAARTARLGDANGRTNGAESMAIAQRLGAATLISGEVTRGSGRYLLDLAVRDVASGTIRHRLTVSDTNLFALVHQATARVLAAVDRRSVGFEDVETSSVDAYRAYVRAIDRNAAGRPAEAAQLFDVAVAADSTFAGALQLRMQLITSITAAAQDSLRRLRSALARAHREESDFDRHASAVLNAIRGGDTPQAAALGRELVTRYPRDSRAHGLFVTALQRAGDFAEAKDVATRALTLDTAARVDGDGPCATCALYSAITISALALGDASGATTAARQAVTLEPAEPGPWSSLARALVASGQPADAIAAATRALQLAPREAAVAEGLGWLLVETGHWEAADSLIRDWGRPGNDFMRLALDLRGALLRERGQYNAATRAYAHAVDRALGAGDTASLRLVHASSLGLGGDPVAAARMFELAALHFDDDEQRRRVGLTPALEARAFAWPHALLADALFLGGSRDTLRLIALADSIEIVGRRSGFGRDVRLHFHVRGLVAEIGGRWSEAERAFEKARWGRGGWSRTNIEIARVQIAQGRPRDAIATLHETRFGTLGGMGRYAPRTEIATALAEAFLVAHQPDSAAVYLARVRDAWSQADPPQRRRLAAIEREVRRVLAISAS